VLLRAVSPGSLLLLLLLTSVVVAGGGVITHTYTFPSHTTLTKQ
jgi:hypothetical protein